MGHLEKLLNDSNLSNADTERLDPDSLYKRVQITHKTQKQEDLFYMDEQEHQLILKGITQTLDKIDKPVI